MADLQITGSPYPTSTVGVAYSFTPTVTGGLAPYLFSLVGGASFLPAGLSFSSSTGTISGTPTAAEQVVNLGLVATDARGATASMPFNLSIQPSGNIPAVNVPGKPSVAVSSTTPGQVTGTITDAASNGGSAVTTRRVYRRRSFEVRGAKIAETQGTTFTDTNVPGGTWAYHARTLNVAGESDRSDEQTVVVAPASSGGGPTPLTLDYFAGDVATVAHYGAAVGYNALYDPASNKTFIAREALTSAATNTRKARVVAYDHSAGSYGASFDSFTSGLTDDDHGVPAIEIDANGYLYTFGGAHGANLKIASTTSPRDPSTFSQRSDLVATSGAGDGYSYPHPSFVNGAIYLFTRKMGTSYNGAFGRMPYSLNVSTGLGASGPTFNADKLLIDWGDNTRCYSGNHEVRGTDIYICMTRADFGDTFRQDVFIFIYSTVDGSIRNLAGTASFTSAQLTSTPITLAQSNASFRVVNQNATSTYGNIPSMCFDTAGNLHLLYVDGAGGNNVARTTLAVMHTIWNGLTWSTPVQVATTKQRYDGAEIAPTADGGVEALVTTVGTYDFLRGGKISYFSRPSSGSWSAGATLYDDTQIYGLDRGTRVRNANPALRWLFCEFAQPPFQGNTGGASNLTSDGGILRAYAAGGSPLAVIGAPFTPRSDTAAWIARVAAAGAATPTTAWQKAYDEFFAGIAQTNVGLDAYYLLAAHDPKASLQNTAQNAYNLTVGGAPLSVSVGSMGAVAYKGDGVSAYLNTNFNPTAATGPKLTQNSCHMAAAGLSGEQQAVVDVATDINQTAGGLYIGIRNAADKARWRAADNGPGSLVPNTDGTLFVIGRRTSSTQRDTNVNVGSGATYSGASQNALSESVTSSGVPNGNITILRDNVSYSARTLDMVCFGGGVGFPQEGLLRNVRRRYLTNIGVATQ